MMETQNCNGQPDIEWCEVVRIGAEHQSGLRGNHLSQSLEAPSLQKRKICRQFARLLSLPRSIVMAKTLEVNHAGLRRRGLQSNSNS